MFFRRERPKTLTFDERLESLKRAGFTVDRTPEGHVKVSRNGCTALLARSDDGFARVMRSAGIMIGDEIGALIDGGYQKFFQTPSGKRKPALAEELKALHDFEEDLRDGLGMVSKYNEALGTVSTYYLYDRVKDRDAGVPKRIWEQ